MKKLKRGILLRTLSGFLAVWLVFAIVSGVLLLRDAQDGLDRSVRRTLEWLNESLLYDQMNRQLNGRRQAVSVQGNAISWACYDSPVLEAGALYRWRETEPDYVTGLTCSAALPFDPDDPSRNAVTFSLLELLNEEQCNALLEALRGNLEQAARQRHSPGGKRECLDAFVSGWVRGDRLYPYRLVVAKQLRGNIVHMDGYSWDLSGMEIVFDWHFDPESIWQTNPGWLGSGRSMENVMLGYDFPLAKLSSRTYADYMEMRSVAQDQSLRARAAAQRLEQFSAFSDSVVILRDGLPRGQYYVYAESDSWEYAFAGRADPLRDALPKIAAVWFASLLLVMTAGGLVCRGMCRVYERQSALEQNRRDTANALAHDLKTPLSLIQGYAENLQFGIRPEKHPHYLAQIRQEAKRMDGILGGFLELSRLEAGILPLHREPLPLRPLAEECAERCRTAAELRNITLLVRGEGTLSADRELLARMFDNLLSNALRHTPDGGTITVTVSPAEITVENTGEPIPPEALPHLFEAYYTGDRSRSGGKRHGLGLAVVRAVAERHGMRAAAENTGSGVKIRLDGARVRE